MGTRLIKETREMLPLLIGTLFLIAVPYVIWQPQAGGWGYLVLGVGCIAMATSAFGSELQHKTIWLLFSQPISRTTIWVEKMVVLVSAIAVSTLLLYACLRIYAWEQFSAFALIFIPLCAFCGAPYLTLIARTGIGGAVFSIALPGTLCASAHLISDLKYVNDPARYEFPARLLAVPLAIYCVLGLSLGYAKFKRLQVLENSSEGFSLPGWIEGFLIRPWTWMVPKKTGAFTSLVLKEIRLQQMSFIIAGLFCLGGLAGALVKARYQHRFGTDYEIYGHIYYVLYLSMLPLVAGVISAAEERAQGILDWHLTLPPSARKQWLAKMLMTLTISLVLGLFLPFLLHVSGVGILHSDGLKASLPSPDLQPLIVLGNLLLTSVAVFVGSFSKSTLRAVLLAIGLVVVLLSCMDLPPMFSEKIFQNRSVFVHLGLTAPEQWILAASGLFLTFCFLQAFAYGHYRQLGSPQILIVLQTAALWLLALISAYFVMCYLWANH